MHVMPLSIGTLHFVGIGGIGMSGIAEILKQKGYDVQGSDIAESGNVERLRKGGIRVHVGHKAANLVNHKGDAVSVVVVSSAIKADNPELIAARQQRILVIRRAEMLAELMRVKRSVAIAGTHGKTTTTSLVAAMLEAGGFDPTVINGGIVNAYGTNTRHGEGEWMVAEADESDGTFTRLPAQAAVVTNIDPEHLDFYGDFESIKDAFRTFVMNIPFYGFAALCSDHPVVQAMLPDLCDRKVVTYGFNPQADIRAENLRPSPSETVFDVVFKPRLSDDGKARTLKDVRLPMLGEHNVQNALAAIVVAHETGMSDAHIKEALGGFSGVKRRFTKTGESNGLTVIDDYGHHPVEIAAVLKAARTGVAQNGGRVHAIVQPHRYTRLHSLFEDFCTCMNDADSVMVLDVYEAGEKPIDGISGETLAQGLTRHGHRDVRYVSDPKDLAHHIAQKAQSGDMVVCLGAGSITKMAYDLPAQLDAAFTGKESAGGSKNNAA